MVRLPRKKGGGAEGRKKEENKRQDKRYSVIVFSMFSICPLDLAQLCCCLKLTERNISFVCFKSGLNMHHLSKFNGPEKLRVTSILANSRVTGSLL